MKTSFKLRGTSALQETKNKGEDLLKLDVSQILISSRPASNYQCYTFPIYKIWHNVADRGAVVQQTLRHSAATHMAVHLVI